MVRFEKGTGLLTLEEASVLGRSVGHQEIVFTGLLNTGEFPGIWLLETSPNNHAFHVLATFCDEYMFYDYRASDDQMFLYRKK